ncbi:MAG: hypothetical protein ACTHM2_10090 [Afipia sp.]
MSTIRFTDQRFPIDPLLNVESRLASGEAIAGAELIEAVEASYKQPVPGRLRAIIGAAQIPVATKRGRPFSLGARQDFAMYRLDQRYPALLRYEQRRQSAVPPNRVRSGSDDLTPSGRAYDRLRRHMQRDFNNIATWQSLRNLHTRWKYGRLYGTDYPETDDLSEQIDFHFPPPEQS